jgi:hypothetical protein
VGSHGFESGIFHHILYKIKDLQEFLVNLFCVLTFCPTELCEDNFRLLYKASDFVYRSFFENSEKSP